MRYGAGDDGFLASTLAKRVTLPYHVDLVSWPYTMGQPGLNIDDTRLTASAATVGRNHWTQYRIIGPGRQAWMDMWMLNARCYRDAGANVITFELMNEPSYMGESEDHYAEFERRLQDRYDTVAEVNRTWGTDFPTLREASVYKFRYDKMPPAGQRLDYDEYLSERFTEMIADGVQAVSKILPDALVGVQPMGGYLRTLHNAVWKHRIARHETVVLTPTGGGRWTRGFGATQPTDTLLAHPMADAPIENDLLLAVAGEKMIVDNETYLRGQSQPLRADRSRRTSRSGRRLVGARRIDRCSAARCVERRDFHEGGRGRTGVLRSGRRSVGAIAVTAGMFPACRLLPARRSSHHVNCEFQRNDWMNQPTIDRRSFLRCAAAGLAAVSAPGDLPGKDIGHRDHLDAIRAYADCLLTKGRDRYGSVHSPLFAEALDRETLAILDGDRLRHVAAITRDQWGLRPHDRMLGGANPQHCQNLFQVLYALTAITGEPKYAREADRSLRWFLKHCQSPKTGLFYWGEHAGWDLSSDKPGEYASGNTHEFFRPWVLWDRCWKLSPDACRRFALGLWEHQIVDHETGDYSRHAFIDRHGPGRGSPYPRHGGFYVLTWAKAYHQTGDVVYLKAIRAVVRGLERDRRGKGMVISRDRKSGTRRPFDISLVISLDAAVPLLPDDLAAELRKIADRNDRAAEEEFRTVREVDHASRNHSDASGPTVNLWSSGYGSYGGEIAGSANVRLERYRQTKGKHFRVAAVAAADRYLASEIDLSFPVHPGTVGKVVWLLVGVHEITEDQRYLNRADHFADQSMKLFLDDCPLPKASHTHNHYEAISGADTLIMALLRLWAVRQEPAKRLDLVYTDR